MTAGGKSWELNNFFFLKYSENLHCITKGLKQDKSAVLCIYKNYRIKHQHKCLGHKALCKEPIQLKCFSSDPN